MLKQAGTAPPFPSLAAFYFFYFALLGAFIPYWSIYLDALGFTPAQIGELFAFLMATKIVGPVFWGWVVDHGAGRLFIIRLTAFLGLLGFTLIFFVDGYWGLALVLVSFSLAFDATLPQFEAVTLNHLGENAHRYSRIRLWGSVGFILAASLVAPAMSWQGARILPWILLVLFIAIWINTLLVPDDHGHPQGGETYSIWRALWRVEVVALFVACFFMQASHGPYYSLFSVYLEQYGYTRTTVGLLWSVGVVAEIVAFAFMHRWLPRYGPVRLILIALSVTAARWLIIAFWVEHDALLWGAQLMHAVSYGLFHSAAMHLIQQMFPGRLQGRGQALYASLSFGLGGALGSYLSGHVWEGLGPHWIFIAGSALALAGLLTAWLGLRPRPVLARSSGS